MIELLFNELVDKLVLQLEGCPTELVVVVVFSACVELVCVDGRTTIVELVLTTEVCVTGLTIFELTLMIEV